jgi:hypothetical protein
LAEPKTPWLYPYREDPQQTRLGQPVFRPFVPVSLAASDASTPELEGLIDTGADAILASDLRNHRSTRCRSHTRTRRPWQTPKRRCRTPSYLSFGASIRAEERRGWTYTKVNRCISEGRAALAA